MSEFPPTTTDAALSQDLVRLVSDFFDALEEGQQVQKGSLLRTIIAELDKNPALPKQLNLDDAHHELD